LNGVIKSDYKNKVLLPECQHTLSVRDWQKKLGVIPAGVIKGVNSRLRQSIVIKDNGLVLTKCTMRT